MTARETTPEATAVAPLTDRFAAQIATLAARADTNRRTPAGQSVTPGWTRGDSIVHGGSEGLAVAIAALEQANLGAVTIAVDSTGITVDGHPRTANPLLTPIRRGSYSRRHKGRISMDAAIPLKVFWQPG